MYVLYTYRYLKNFQTEVLENICGAFLSKSEDSVQILLRLCFVLQQRETLFQEKTLKAIKNNLES